MIAHKRTNRVLPNNAFRSIARQTERHVRSHGVYAQRTATTTVSSAVSSSSGTLIARINETCTKFTTTTTVVVHRLTRTTTMNSTVSCSLHRAKG